MGPWPDRHIVFLPGVLVAQAASGQGDEHQSRHARADQHRKGTAVAGDQGSGKEQTHGPTSTSKDVCSKMASSMLPFVLLNTHVKTMVMNITAARNRTMVRMVEGVPQTLTQNRGRCQHAQSGPRIRVPTRGLCSRCSRGRETPPPSFLEQRLLRRSKQEEELTSKSSGLRGASV